MTEAHFTQRLLRALRQAMPDATIFKFNDRTTAGIPDFCICQGGKTTWCEVKLLGPPSVMFKPLQLEMLKRLHGIYVVWNPKTKAAYVAVAASCPKDFRSSYPYTFTELVEWFRSAF